MVLASNYKKPLLQRRNNWINSLQAALDGFAVIAIMWSLVIYHLGELTPEYIIMLLILMGMMAVTYDYFGVYRNNANFTGKAIVLFKGWSIIFLGLVLMAFITKQSETYSRLIMIEMYFIGYLSQFLLHILVRFVHHSIIKNTQTTSNVIIAGQGRLADYLHYKISNNLWMGEKVVGSVSFASKGDTERSHEFPHLSPVLGDIIDLPSLIDEFEIDTVYIVTPLESSGVLEQVYFKLLDKHVSIHWVPDIFSLRLVNHSVREVAGIPVLTLSETPLIGLSRISKSIEDFLLSIIIFTFIAPVLALVALAVKLDSPGPVFFRQKRAGWNGKKFSIWKFRSMYVNNNNAEESTVKQAEKNDPRVTRVGAFIRKTSLDELPQIFNVLLGDMSLVGPRPHAIQHDKEYSERINDYFARHRIKPGITGLAQVRGLRGETKDINQMIQRIESDIEYINHWSVWLDLSILLRTAKVFSGKNAY